MVPTASPRWQGGLEVEAQEPANRARSVVIMPRRRFDLPRIGNALAASDMGRWWPVRPSVRAGLLGLVLVASLATPVLTATAQTSGDTLVSVGSPDGPFSRNKQNEPAGTVAPSHPWLVAAGANDEIDMEACNAGPQTDCPFTENVGTSGVYFSFHSAPAGTQPTYTGLTARSPFCDGDPTTDSDVCVAQEGPIETVAWYAETGLVPVGETALAI